MNPFYFHVPAMIAPLIGFGLFALFWVGLVRLMRRLAKMTDTLPPDAGALLRRSRAGNATINGARAKNCVRVYEYANGHAIRMSRIFGGGLVWLPRNATTVHAPDPHSRELRYQAHQITLSGHLAEFMGESPTAPPVLTQAAVHRATPVASGLQAVRPQAGGSRLSRIAIVVAIALLAFVVVRRSAPELLAPLDALISTLSARL
ncbi:MAG: hypothetical protein KDE68_13010 [Rhodocyclaceae bacterium]|nr:hypothetical protein [Rhodocyclaceae bacterium]